MKATYLPKVKTKVGSRDLICTSAVHLSGEDSFEIFLDDWSCRVVFLKDSESSRFEVGVGDDGKLIVRLFNHVNMIGESIFKPIILAKAGDTVISMTYWTQLIVEDTMIRRFEYSLWAEAN